MHTRATIAEHEAKITQAKRKQSRKELEDIGTKGSNGAMNLNMGLFALRFLQEIFPDLFCPWPTFQSVGGSRALCVHRVVDLRGREQARFAHGRFAN